MQTLENKPFLTPNNISILTHIFTHPEKTHTAFSISTELCTDYEKTKTSLTCLWFSNFIKEYNEGQYVLNMQQKDLINLLSLNLSDPNTSSIKTIPSHSLSTFLSLIKQQTDHSIKDNFKHLFIASSLESTIQTLSSLDMDTTDLKKELSTLPPSTYPLITKIITTLYQIEPTNQQKH